MMNVRIRITQEIGRVKKIEMLPWLIPIACLIESSSFGARTKESRIGATGIPYSLK